MSAVESSEPLGSGAMFDAIAGRYDLVNRVLSLGLDRGWRRRAVEAMNLGDGIRSASDPSERNSKAVPCASVVDLATGTGDLALAVLAAHPDAQVIGLDPSSEMLRIGREKAARLGVSITFREGDALAIDLADAYADATSIAFGIRNVADRRRALAEMARVTKASGRVVVLELAEPERGALGRLAKLYVHEIVPRLGGALSGAREYAYLQRSIAAFPPARAFAETMGESGLDVLDIVPLTFGAATLFIAKPSRTEA